MGMRKVFSPPRRSWTGTGSGGWWGRGMGKHSPIPPCPIVIPRWIQVGCWLRLILTKLNIIFTMRLNCFIFGKLVDMLAELSRREKTANVKPDLDLDIYMKVRKHKIRVVSFCKSDPQELIFYRIDRCI